MQTFHFNAFNGGATPDPTGTELENVVDAKCNAMRYLAEILNEKASRRQGCDDLRVEVTDDSGLILFTVSASIIDAPAMGAKTD